MYPQTILSIIFFFFKKYHIIICSHSRGIRWVHRLTLLDILRVYISYLETMLSPLLVPTHGLTIWEKQWKSKSAYSSSRWSYPLLIHSFNECSLRALHAENKVASNIDIVLPSHSLWNKIMVWQQTGDQQLSNSNGTIAYKALLLLRWNMKLWY